MPSTRRKRRLQRSEKIETGKKKRRLNDNTKFDPDEEEKRKDMIWKTIVESVDRICSVIV